MRRLVLVALAAVALVMSGCAGNLFMDMDTPEAPTFDASSADQTDVADYVDQVNRNLDVASDEDMRNAAENLDGALTGDSVTWDPSDQVQMEERQKTAATAGFLYVSSNPAAMDVVNGIGALATELQGSDGTSGETQNPEEIISKVIPTGLSQTEFTEMVESLQSASAMFDILTDPDGDGTLNPDPVLPDGVQAGDIAQTAVLSLALKTASEALVDDDGDGTSDELFEVYRFYTDPNSDTSNPPADLPTFDPNNDPVETLTAAGGQAEIFLGMAGLDGLFDDSSDTSNDTTN